MKPNLTKMFGFLFPIALCFLITACGSSKPPGPPPDANAGQPEAKGSRGGTAVYRITSAPTTFNYLLAADEPTVVTAFYLLSSRLVDFDHRSRNYVPALAESWQTSPDGMTVDVSLREGLKFSDGHPLTTEDVAFTLKALYDERTNSPAFRDSLLIDDKPIEVKISDDRRLQLIFPKKVASVETYLTNFGILPAHVLRADLDAGTLNEAWKLDSDPKAIVTSGPFVVEAVTPGERIALARNQHFWKSDTAGTRLPYLDRLTLEVIEDPNNALAKLLQNQLDIVDKIRPADYASLSSGNMPAKVVDVGPGMSTDYFWFNHNKSKGSGERLDNKPKYRWFSDRRFRRAVSHAVDRNSIAQNALRGLATPLYGFVSPANQAWVAPDLPKTEYDLDAAKRLLTEAGFSWKTGGDVPELFDAEGNRVEFTLLIPAGNEPRSLIAAVIQEDLARLGIKMDIAPVDIQSISERWAKSFDYDAILLGLGVTDFEPSSFANFLMSSGATHQWQPLQKKPATEWEAKIDDQFAEQAVESDHSKRAAKFVEIQNLVAEELPIIPVVARHVISAVNPRIGNYSPSSVMPNSLWNVEELFIKQ